MQTMRRASVVLVIALGLVLGGPMSPAFAFAPAAASADATWARGAALPSGAIAVYVDRQRVLPYLGNFAAWGLAVQGGRTRDIVSLRAAWSHLAWYAAAQDAAGFVTDYVVDPGGGLTSTGDMDSTDSYAGTFFLAADAAYQASNQVEGKSVARARLTALSDGLDGALRAVEATTDADGLTWAKPAWHVKYLMDQAEVYAGLQAATRLFTSLGDPARAARASTGGAARRQRCERPVEPEHPGVRLGGPRRRDPRTRRSVRALPRRDGAGVGRRVRAGAAEAGDHAARAHQGAAS